MYITNNLNPIFTDAELRLARSPLVLPPSHTRTALQVLARLELYESFPYPGGVAISAKMSISPTKKSGLGSIKLYETAHEYEAPVRKGQEKACTRVVL